MGWNDGGSIAGTPEPDPPHEDPSPIRILPVGMYTALAIETIENRVVNLAKTFSVPVPRVELDNRAYYVPGRRAIVVYDGVSLATLLHEFAHYLQHVRCRKVPWPFHGRVYARTLLQVVAAAFKSPSDYWAGGHRDYITVYRSFAKEGYPPPASTWAGAVEKVAPRARRAQRRVRRLKVGSLP